MHTHKSKFTNLPHQDTSNHMQDPDRGETPSIKAVDQVKFQLQAWGPTAIHPTSTPAQTHLTTALLNHRRLGLRLRPRLAPPCLGPLQALLL